MTHGEKVPFIFILVLLVILGLGTYQTNKAQQEVSMWKTYVDGVLTERGCPVSTGPMDKQLEE